MATKERNKILAITISIILFGGFVMFTAFIMKWNGSDVEILREKCNALGMELTDYNFMIDGWEWKDSSNGIYHIQDLLFECDGKIMGEPVYLEKVRVCTDWSKWGGCITEKQIIRERFVPDSK